METKESTATQASKGEKPWPIIIMLAMLFVVIVAGLVLAPQSEEGKLRWLNILGTTNHGAFLNPPTSLAGAVASSQSEDWTADEQQPWKLLLVSKGDCNDDCQALADVAARVHTRLNRAAPEMKRGYVSIDGGSTPEQGLGYENLSIANQQSLDMLLDAGAPAWSEGPLLFLVDPLQVSFMYYDVNHQGSGMLEDIEHVMELAR